MEENRQIERLNEAMKFHYERMQKYLQRGTLKELDDLVNTIYATPENALRGEDAERLKLLMKEVDDLVSNARLYVRYARNKSICLDPIRS